MEKKNVSKDLIQNRQWKKKMNVDVDGDLGSGCVAKTYKPHFL